MPLCLKNSKCYVNLVDILQIGIFGIVLPLVWTYKIVYMAGIPQICCILSTMLKIIVLKFQGLVKYNISNCEKNLGVYKMEYDTIYQNRNEHFFVDV